jgi:hypothetical protein
VVLKVLPTFLNFLDSVVHGFENQSDYEKILWCMALKISQIMKKFCGAWL